MPVPSNTWGYSSAGRALEWHSRGQRFDPAYLHQRNALKSYDFKAFSFYSNNTRGRGIASPSCLLVAGCTIILNSLTGKNSRCDCIGCFQLYRSLRILPSILSDAEQTTQKATHPLRTLDHHNTHKTTLSPHRLQQRQLISKATTKTPIKKRDGKIQQANKPRAKATNSDNIPSPRRRRRIKQPPAFSVSVNRICRGLKAVSIF